MTCKSRQPCPAIKHLWRNKNHNDCCGFFQWFIHQLSAKSMLQEDNLKFPPMAKSRMAPNSASAKLIAAKKPPRTDRKDTSLVLLWRVRKNTDMWMQKLMSCHVLNPQLQQLDILSSYFRTVPGEALRLDAQESEFFEGAPYIVCVQSETGRPSKPQWLVPLFP